MRQLPGAGHTKDHELDQNPADDACIGGLGLVAEIGLALALEDLFAANITHTAVEVVQPAQEVLELVLVGALKLA